MLDIMALAWFFSRRFFSLFFEIWLGTSSKSMGDSPDV